LESRLSAAKIHLALGIVPHLAAFSTAQSHFTQSLELANKLLARSADDAETLYLVDELHAATECVARQLSKRQRSQI
jgi:hypothetical protein